MTTLALPPKVETAIKPKPTKSEIISAMVRVHIQKHDADQKAIAAKRATIGEEIEKLIKKLPLRGRIASVNLGYCHDRKGGEYSGVRISFDLDEGLPTKIRSRLDAYHALPKCALVLDEKKVRREIACKLEGIGTADERVDALLEDPESRKGLEKMLQLIGK